MFEYKAITASTYPSPEQLTDVFGADGWELIQIMPRDGEFLLYFKRQVISA